MTRNNRNYRRQKSKTERNGRIIGIIAIIFSIAVGGGIVYLMNTQIDVDEVTLCPIDGAIATTVVIIDATDSFNAIQKNSIEIELNKVRSATKKHESIQIFNITDEVGSLLIPTFNACNPGSGEGANFLYENEELINKLWNENFSNPLNMALEQATLKASYASSPILESIQSVAGASFGVVHENTPKKLVIVSDMLQNSEMINFYKGIPSFESVYQSNNLSSMSSLYLKGVDVTILMLNRPNRAELQNNTNVLFWERYFTSQGARLVSVKRIDG